MGSLVVLSKSRTAGLLVIGGGPWGKDFPRFSTVGQGIPQKLSDASIVVRAQVK